jgi:hypothetical protein
MTRAIPWLPLLGCLACVIDPPGMETEGTTTGSSTTDVDSSSSTTMVEPVDSTTSELDTTGSEGVTETLDTTETTGPLPACDEPDGTFGGACSAAAPFCVGGECVPCSQDPLTTCTVAPELVCDDSGACVMCSAEDTTACQGETPYCDPGTNACVPCTEHAQCGASACNLFTGACVGGMVVTVGAGQQFTTLASAVASLAGSDGTMIVYAGTYDEAVTVAAGTVAFLANPGDAPEWQRTLGLGAPQLRVTSNATVLIDGINMLSNDSSVDPALRVDGASLWLDRSRIAQNDGVAVRAEVSATVMLRNCFVSGTNNLPVLQGIMGSNITAASTTLGANFGASTALLCDAAAIATVTDSIILTRGTQDGVDCPMLTVDYTAANTLLPGNGNVEVGDTVSTWFSSYDDGDFHLTASGQDMFMNIAEWNVGDSSVDIDGMARSLVDGTPEHAGAGVP